MRIHGGLYMGRSFYAYHIEQRNETSEAKGIMGGKILVLNVYEDDELIISYHKDWKKKCYRKRPHDLLKNLLSEYN